MIAFNRLLWSDIAGEGGQLVSCGNSGRCRNQPKISMIKLCKSRDGKRILDYVDSPNYVTHLIYQFVLITLINAIRQYVMKDFENRVFKFELF